MLKVLNVNNVIALRFKLDRWFSNWVLRMYMVSERVPFGNIKITTDHNNCTLRLPSVSINREINPSQLHTDNTHQLFLIIYHFGIYE